MTFIDGLDALELARSLDDVETREAALLALLRDRDERVVLEFVRGIRDAAQVPVEFLMKLAVHPDQDVRAMLAGAVNGLPGEVLMVLVEDSSVRVLAALARKHELPAVVVHRLVDMESADVWLGLIGNRKFFSAEAVEGLWVRNQRGKNLEVVNVFIRDRLASDARTPVRLFEELAEYSDVWGFLLENEGCPVDVLVRAVKRNGGHHSVRMIVAARVAAEPEYAGVPVEWVETFLFG